MELRRLRYFIAVAEELHFGRAAARLDMAQPPLSRQIAALEAELEVLLFDRARSQIRLTPAGEVLLLRARDLVRRQEEAWREARLIGQGGAGRLRIAFVGSATHGPLPALIKTFRQRYPQVDLSLSAMNNAELESALIQGEIDLAFARPRLRGEDLRSQLFAEEPLILALPESNPLSEAAGIPALQALAGESFILYPRWPRPSFADHQLMTCGLNGFAPREQVLAQDYQTAISLVSVGVGLSLVPASVSHVRHPGVVFRSFAGVNPGTKLTLQARMDNRNPLVMNFFKVLTGFAKTPR